jgi:hypothetical protein
MLYGLWIPDQFRPLWIIFLPYQVKNLLFYHPILNSMSVFFYISFKLYELLCVMSIMILIRLSRYVTNPLTSSCLCLALTNIFWRFSFPATLPLRHHHRSKGYISIPLMIPFDSVQKTNTSSMHMSIPHSHSHFKIRPRSTYYPPDIWPERHHFPLPDLPDLPPFLFPVQIRIIAHRTATAIFRLSKFTSTHWYPAIRTVFICIIVQVCFIN